MSYLFDLHVHTSESSRCGKVSAADVVKRYINLGYDGICITDHMNKDNAKPFGDTYEQKAEAFLKGYQAAKKAAGDSFKVILGMEIRFLEYDNDFLVYGFDEDFVFKRDLTNFENIEEFKPFAIENNLTVFQAHPFRENMTIIDPKYIDGMEVYNGHGGHDSRNDIAYRWACKYNLRKSSSSDFHYDTGMEPGGMYFDNLPKDSHELAKMLLDESYHLKIWTE
jgi:predicted metal-dependent phosphoesterase TrpH